MTGRTELHGGGFSGILHAELCPGKNRQERDFEGSVMREKVMSCVCRQSVSEE